MSGMHRLTLTSLSWFNDCCPVFVIINSFFIAIQSRLTMLGSNIDHGGYMSARHVSLSIYMVY